MTNKTEQHVKAIEYITMVIVLINLVITTVGGYFYVGRYEAKLFQSEVDLNELKKNMVTLELKFAEEKRKYEALGTKLTYSSDLIEFINSVQPRYTVKTVPQMTIDGHRVSVYYEITNIGKYDLNTTIVGYSLFQIDGYPLKKKEVPIHDITLGKRSDIEPNSTQQQDISFSIDSNTKGSYYFEVVVEAEIDKKIQDLSINLMKQYEQKMPNGYFKKKYTGTGRFTIK